MDFKLKEFDDMYKELDKMFSDKNSKKYLAMKKDLDDELLKLKGK